MHPALAVLMMLIGPATSAAGTYLVIRTLHRRRRWRCTEGTVIRWRDDVPTIAYLAHDGQVHHLAEERNSEYFTHPVGSTCRVWYDPADTKTAMTNYRGGPMRDAWVLAIAGLVWTVMALSWAADGLR